MAEEDAKLLGTNQKPTYFNHQLVNMAHVVKRCLMKLPFKPICLSKTFNDLSIWQTEVLTNILMTYSLQQLCSFEKGHFQWGVIFDVNKLFISWIAIAFNEES